MCFEILINSREGGACHYRPCSYRNLSSMSVSNLRRSEIFLMLWKGKSSSSLTSSSSSPSPTAMYWEPSPNLAMIWLKQASLPDQARGRVSVADSRLEVVAQCVAASSPI
jgi:hypothetical protein